MSKSYPTSHHLLIDRMEKHHFWYGERNTMIRNLLLRFIKRPQGKRFLEIGCGTGILLPVLKNAGFSVAGMDINKEALRFAKRKHTGRLIRSSLYSYKGKERYDGVGIFDVLEHQQDDQKFLGACSRLLKPAGYLFLSVPSHAWLWSSVDELSGHIRRYEQRDLTEKLKKAGFTVCFSNHWNILLFGFYILWRLQFLSTRKKFSVRQFLKIPFAPINQMCRFILHLEQRFLFTVPVPFGSSLIVVAKKNHIR